MYLPASDQQKISSLHPVRFGTNSILYVDSEEGRISNSIRELNVITKRIRSIFTLPQGQSLQWAFIDEILYVLDANLYLTKISLDSNG